MHVWLVLPAYNEADNLPALLDGCRRLLADTYRLSLHILLVDDGSTDGTAEVAQQHAAGLSLEVLTNGRNRGLAETFMRGMVAAAARANPDDVIVCMDADNSHLPGQIQRMTRMIQEGFDVVVASRYRPGSVIRGVPLVRRVLSRCMSWLFRLVHPVPGIRDYSCGYRAYRAGMLQAALAHQGERLFTTEGFACMVGILLRLSKEDALCGEIPLVLRYDHKIGETKMKVGSTVLKTLAVLLRERLTIRQAADRQTGFGKTPMPSPRTT